MKELLHTYLRQFDALDVNSRRLLEKIPGEKLFLRPRELSRTMAMFSCGEYLLRSAAAVEQTFGGLTTRLWDDPFEWTLPEELETKAKISEYFAEVETTRRNGFEFFTSDADLQKQLPAPEKLKTIHQILLETIARAAHYQGRAYAVFQMISDEGLPHFDAFA